MKKVLIIALLSVLLVSCGNKDNKEKESQNNKETEKVVEKYGDITKFVKSNITDEESEKLVKILEDRKERQKEVSEMIKNASKENKDEVYKKIVEKRTNCKNRILPYIEESKKLMFEAYCNKYNKAIKKTLDNK